MWFWIRATAVVSFTVHQSQLQIPHNKQRDSTFHEAHFSSFVPVKIRVPETKKKKQLILSASPQQYRQTLLESMQSTGSEGFYVLFIRLFLWFKPLRLLVQLPSRNPWRKPEILKHKKIPWGRSPVLLLRMRRRKRSAPFVGLHCQEDDSTLSIKAEVIYLNSHFITCLTTLKKGS